MSGRGGWRTGHVGLVLLGGLAGCALGNRVPPPPSPADSALARGQLASVLSSYFRSVLPGRPDIAMALGRRVDALPSPGGAIDDKRAPTLARRITDDLESIDPAALSPRDYATLQTLRWEVESSAEASTYGLMDFSLISPSLTPLRHVVRVLIDHPFSAPADLNRYLFHLDGLAYWLQDVRTALEERRRRSSVASADAALGFAAFLRQLWALGAGGAWRVADHRLASIDPGLVTEYRALEAEAIRLRVQPAFDTLLVFLEGYGAQAMSKPGLWQYPGGKEYYRYLLRRSLGVEVEPGEAHQVAMSELRRLDSLLAVVRRRLPWSVEVVQDSLRRSARFAPVTMDSALALARLALARIRDTLAQRIAVPAKLLVPEIRVASPLDVLLEPAGLVRPPEYNDSAAVIALTPYWTSREALIEGPSLHYRMNWPGAVLAATANYSADTLSPIVLLHPSGATQAGWSEYAASIAGELGLYADPLDAYGRLLHEAWNAAMLLVDTGVHYYGWSKQQALAALRPYSVASDAGLDSLFVATVVQAPGTAGAATIGAREFAAMRTWMQRLLGDGFDVRAWHAEVLALGPVPLPVLAAHLEWWGWNERRKRAAAAGSPRK